MDPYGDPAGLDALLRDEPTYRRDQVRGWLARGVDDPQGMTDLPVALRDRLAGAFDPPPTIVRHVTADGGRTHKVLLRLADGEAIESVCMLYPAADADAPAAEPDVLPGDAERGRPRATVCISTQAGCALGCPFCATGQAGLRRQLTVGEIVRQVTVVERLLRTGAIDLPGAPDHVTNIVFMGMGEPLANLDATLAALAWLTAPEGFGLSPRRVTVSTVGLVPGIRRLTDTGLPITLALSLHAPNDALRDDLVPVNRQFPIADVLAACAAWRRRTRRRLTIEYILIGGVNDARAHARELAERVGDLRAHVNLIPCNPTPGVGWDAPPVAQQRAFARVLADAGLAVTIRHNRGSDIDAACGQLYAEYAAGSGRTLPQAVGAAGRLGGQR